MRNIIAQATGEFDPIGTLFTLGLLVVFAYTAYWSWTRLGSASGLKLWGLRVAVVVGGGLAVLTVVAFLLNLGAALGVV